LHAGNLHKLRKDITSVLKIEKDQLQHSNMTRKKVLVTGASGKTGALVVKELLTRPDDFDVKVTVRSDKARDLLQSMGVSPDHIHNINISGKECVPELTAALKDTHGLVICTSAVPEVNMLQTVTGGLGHLLGGLVKRNKEDTPFVPVATWKGGQTPEKVDYEGQVAQIDAAKASGSVQQVVVVSSAGGCDPNHFLNHIGQGDILNWKRKSEQHLVASGLDYTILHPNHLIDAPGEPRQIVLGVDDALQKVHWRQRLKMPRSDLARLCVASLLLKDEGAGNRSVDCAAKLPGDGQPTKTIDDFRALFAGLKGTCDYSINDRTKPDAIWACKGKETT